MVVYATMSKTCMEQKEVRKKRKTNLCEKGKKRKKKRSLGYTVW